MDRSLICMTASVVLVPAMPGPGRSQARAAGESGARNGLKVGGRSAETLFDMNLYLVPTEPSDRAAPRSTPFSTRSPRRARSAEPSS